MATVVFTSSCSLGLGESVRRSAVSSLDSSSGVSPLLAEPVTTTASSDGCGDEEGLLSFGVVFGGDGACSFFGDLISSSLLA